MQTRLALSSRRIRWSILLSGLILPQVILIGPSLFGSKIMLPLDILGRPNCYLPREVRSWSKAPQNFTLADPVLQLEIFRRFAVREVRAGRLPLWNPHNYCGYPFLATNQSAVFSPFRLLDYLWPSPRAIAWGRLLRVLVAGIGAYLFFCLSLRCGFWPSTFGAWAYPLTGFLIWWANYPLADVTVWLPWLLLGVERSVRRPRSLWPVMLSVVTALALVCGHVAMAAQVLIGAGLYLLWQMIEQRQRWSALAAVSAAWLLAMAISAPQNLPTKEYLVQSQRVAERVEGDTNLKPQGPRAVAQLVLPYALGSTQAATVPLGIPISESAATGYAGLVTLLFAVPLAWTNRRRRGACWFFLALALFGLAFAADFRPLAWLWRLPPFSMLRNNRMLALTGFAILALGVMGLDALRRGTVIKGWVIPCAAASAMLAGWCAWRAMHPPVWVEQVLTRAGEVLGTRQDMLFDNLPDAAAIETARRGFAQTHLFGAALCLIVLAFWIALYYRPQWRRYVLGSAGGLILIELIVNAWGAIPQTPAELYYPPRAVLQKLDAQAGRICGVRCLPPNLSQVAGLHDLRGYDAVDPARYIQLLQLTTVSDLDLQLPYSHTGTVVPRLTPITRMLGLRYLILAGRPRPGVQPVADDGEWAVIELANAMPRVFVPAMCMIEDDDSRRLRNLADPRFDPAAVAFVESQGLDTQLPTTPIRGRGRGRIRVDENTHIVIDVEMAAPGLAVIADRWDPGWQATVDGKPAPVLRVNHALRGVIVPAGRHELVYRYRPRSFVLGVQLMGIASLALLAWGVAVWRFNSSCIRTDSSATA